MHFKNLFVTLLAALAVYTPLSEAAPGKGNYCLGGGDCGSCGVEEVCIRIFWWQTISWIFLVQGCWKLPLSIYSWRGSGDTWVSGYGIYNLVAFLFSMFKQAASIRFILFFCVSLCMRSHWSLCRSSKSAISREFVFLNQAALFRVRVIWPVCEQQVKKRMYRLHTSLEDWAVLMIEPVQ